MNVFECLCHNLRKTSRQLTQYYDGVLRPSGIRITQFTLMAAVREMAEPTFVRLADFLGLDRTTLARNVEVLARRGLVRVEHGPTDRRQQVVTLTKKGSDKLELAMPLWESAQRRTLKQLEAGKLAGLLKSLSVLSEVV